jgi:hypothetical protein
MKSVFWLAPDSMVGGEPAPKTLATSKGARSSTMLAVENAPTSHPARVKGTHGAGVLRPVSVTMANVWSSEKVLMSLTRSVQ